MAKTAEAFRTISEVADDLDLPQHVLRFWETRFSQIKPLKRGGGRRYYRPDDVNILRGIRHLLYGEGYTIKGVQRIFKEQGARYVSNIWRTDGDHPEDAVASNLDTTASTGELDLSVPQQAGVNQAVPLEVVEDTASSVPAAAPVAVPAMAAPPTAAPPMAAPEIVAPAAVPTAPVANVHSTSAQPAAVAVTPQAVESPLVVAKVPAEAPKPVQMPPFVVQTQAPDHLVKPIRTSVNQQQIIQPNVAQTQTQAEEIPADILLSNTHNAPLKEKPRGILGRLPFSNVEETSGVPGGALLSKEQQASLQGTLFDLLECKRLLDQVR